MPIEDKEEVKKEIEAKETKQEKEWWKTIPTWMLVLGIFIFFLALRGVTLEKGGISQVLILMGVVAVLILLSKKFKVLEGVLTPKEAEFHVERECYRKHAWGQGSIMDKFDIDWPTNAQRRDGSGIFYAAGVTIRNPYRSPKYYLAKVPMRGDERGLVSFEESLVPVTGRQAVPERTLFGLTRKLRQDPFFGKYLFGKG
jgi:hypothetical protein